MASVSGSSSSNNTILDEHDFNLLFQEHWNSVYHACIKYSGSEQDAQELAQDIFISVWRRRDEINMNNISAYLHGAAKLQSLQYLRGKSRRKVVYSDEEPTIIHHDHPGNKIEYKELYASFSDYCEQLPEPGKQVFLLSREYQLSHKEIAKKMNLSIGMVQYHMGSVLKIIRKKFQTYL